MLNTFQKFVVFYVVRAPGCRTVFEMRIDKRLVYSLNIISFDLYTIDLFRRPNNLLAMEYA